MAYNVGNQAYRKLPGSRYIHRQVNLILDGSGAASKQVMLPGAARLIAVTYPAAAHAAALVIKADTTDGVQVWTDADISSTAADALPTPIGGPAIDQAAGATDAADAFSGGFPLRHGVFVDVASGTAADPVQIDLYFRLCSYVVVDLVAQSGADGAGTATKEVRWARAGSIAAIAIDYQNTPNTADVTINADAAAGVLLFTKSNSNTDLAPSLIGRVGADEAAGVSAATDGTEGANMFKQSFFVKVAQTDAFTSGNERTIVELWIDD